MYFKVLPEGSNSLTRVWYVHQTNQYFMEKMEVKVCSICTVFDCGIKAHLSYDFSVRFSHELLIIFECGW